MAIKPEFEQVKYGDDIDAIKWNSNFKEILDYVEDISEELTLKVNTINSQLSSNVLSNLQSIYPVGSIYIGVTETCPIANLFGTWEKVSEGRVLQGADEAHEVGTTIAAGLPNIKGTFGAMNEFAYADGCFEVDYLGTRSEGSYGGGKRIKLNASKSSSVYSDDCQTVQPPAYVVNIWRRTA